jgi:hypothetical protein
MWLPWIGQWLMIPPNVHQADAIAVFGGEHERTQLASRLYRQGMAPQVWHTGWRSESARFPRRGIIAAANQELLDTVPEHALYLLDTENTWEDAQAIANLAREHNVRSILVVTNWFHSRRALCSLRYHMHHTDDITIYYSPVLIEERERERERNIDAWWRQERIRRIVYSEYRKLAYYLLNYGVIPWGC